MVDTLSHPLPEEPAAELHAGRDHAARTLTTSGRGAGPSPSDSARSSSRDSSSIFSVYGLSVPRFDAAPAARTADRSEHACASSMRHFIQWDGRWYRLIADGRLPVRPPGEDLLHPRQRWGDGGVLPAVPDTSPASSTTCSRAASTKPCSGSTSCCRRRRRRARRRLARELFDIETAERAMMLFCLFPGAVVHVVVVLRTAARRVRRGVPALPDAANAGCWQACSRRSAPRPARTASRSAWPARSPPAIAIYQQAAVAVADRRRVCRRSAASAFFCLPACAHRRVERVDAAPRRTRGARRGVGAPPRCATCGGSSRTRSAPASGPLYMHTTFAIVASRVRHVCAIRKRLPWPMTRVRRRASASMMLGPKIVSARPAVRVDRVPAGDRRRGMVAADGAVRLGPAPARLGRRRSAHSRCCTAAGRSSRDAAALPVGGRSRASTRRARSRRSSIGSSASPWVAEIVVVDDGSTDGTAKVLADIDDPRVRVMTHDGQPGQGRRAAHRVRQRERRVRHRAGRRPRVRPVGVRA